MDDRGAPEWPWQLSSASVRGKSHVDGGLENQDCLAVCTDAAGLVVCAVVCDGAGTAPRAREGAEATSRAVARHLCDAARRLPAMDMDDVRRELQACIEALRARIAADLGELHLFHCTMVAWLHAHGHGFVAQVGDSVALSTRFASVDAEGVQQLDLFPAGLHDLHAVERGDYANETHFVTEADWANHLRIHPLAPQVDAVVLMTDGAMDVAMLRGEVFRGFLSNLLARLAGTPAQEERDHIIHAWLDDPRTYKVTGDDKTLFVAIRRAACALDNAPIFLGQRHAVPGDASVSDPPAPPAGLPRTVALVPAEVGVGPAHAATATQPTAVRWRRDGALVVLAAAATLAAAVLLRIAGRHDAAPARPPAESACVRGGPALKRMEMNGQPVAVETTEFEGRAARATLTAHGDAELRIERMAADDELVLDGARAGACRPAQRLRPGQACTLFVHLAPQAEHIEYGVDLQFAAVESGERINSRAVFGWPCGG